MKVTELREKASVSKVRATQNIGDEAVHLDHMEIMAAIKYIALMIVSLVAPSFH